MYKCLIHNYPILSDATKYFRMKTVFKFEISIIIFIFVHFVDRAETATKLENCAEISLSKFFILCL